jgi:putative DNA primase/helicase
MAMRFMSAAVIGRALGGRMAGDEWIARCPSHQDRKPSLSIRDAGNDKILVRCHAGCSQERVVGALRSLGLWMGNGPRLVSRPAPRPLIEHERDRDDVKRRNALDIWQASMPADGTPVRTYLASRGLHTPTPARLRFHATLTHPSGSTWPTMVALVTRGVDDTALGIHRTYLARDGSGKAPVEPQRMMLGPCRGGAVRLGMPDDVLMVGEGLETCLAAMQATGHPAWAALSTSGLRSLDLPKDVRDVVVLADGDEAGEAAARDCALRWKSEGRRVRIAYPPKGMDFNDMLLGRALRTEEGAQ